MAVKKFIDSTGLATLWEKIKALIPGIATSSKAGIVKSGGDITVASDGAVTVNNCLKLSGGTMTGNIKKKEGDYVSLIPSKKYSSYFLQFLKITYVGANLDVPIEIRLLGRGSHQYIIQVNNGSGAPSSVTFYTIGNAIEVNGGIYYKYDSTAKTLSLLFHHAGGGGWEDAAVTDVIVPNNHYDKFTFNYTISEVASTEGWTKASRTTFHYAISERAKGDGDGNVINTTYMKWSDLRDNTTVGGVGWASNDADKVPISSNTLAYWDGASNNTNNFSNLKYFGAELFLKNVKALRNTSDGWLRINDEKTFSLGTFFGTGLVRTDGNFRVGPNADTALDVTQSKFTWKGVNVATVNSTVANANGLRGYVRLRNNNSRYVEIGRIPTTTSAYVDRSLSIFIKGYHNTNYHSSYIFNVFLGTNQSGVSSARIYCAMANRPNYDEVLVGELTSTHLILYLDCVLQNYTGWCYCPLLDVGNLFQPTSGNVYVESIPANGGTKVNQYNTMLAVTDGSGNTITSTYATKTELTGRLNKRCGWCVTNVSTPYWFCIAEYICTTEWFDLNTTFVVSRNFYSQSAIITAKIRHATMGVVEVSELSCISKEGGFPISNLAIAYKGTSGSKSEFQIWAKCEAMYQSMSIMPLYHGTRSLVSNAAEYWTLNQVTHDHTVYRAAVNSDGLFTHPNGFTIKLCTGPEYATKTEALSPYYVTGTDGFYDGYKWDKVISTVKTDTGNAIYTKMFCQGTITNGGYLLIEVLNKGPYTSKSWGIFFISCTNYQSSYYFNVRSVSGNARLSCYHSGSGNFKLYCEMIASSVGTGFTYSVRILRQSNVSFTWQDVTETPPSEVEISDITNIDTRVTNLEKYKTKGSLLYINSLDDSHVTLNNDGADGVGSITINLSTNKEYYSTIVLDLMSSYYHYIPVKSIKVNADVYSGGESIKLIFEGGPGHLIRSDSSYCFAKIPNSTDDFAAVDSGCYAEVVYYGRIWYTSSY